MLLAEANSKIAEYKEKIEKYEVDKLKCEYYFRKQLSYQKDLISVLRTQIDKQKIAIGYLEMEIMKNKVGYLISRIQTRITFQPK